MKDFEPIRRPDKASSWRGDIPIESLYTAGPAAERFFETIRDEGRFIGTRCESCGTTFGPPRLFCEKTMEDLTGNWVDVGPEGTVQSFTLVHVNLDGTRRESPEVLATIQLDAADSVFVHRLDPACAGTIEIGARVAPVFKPQSEREGSILDVVFFKPV